MLCTDPGQRASWDKGFLETWASLSRQAGLTAVPDLGLIYLPDCQARDLLEAGGCQVESCWGVAALTHPHQTPPVQPVLGSSSKQCSQNPLPLLPADSPSGTHVSWSFLVILRQPTPQLQCSSVI